MCLVAVVAAMVMESQLTMRRGFINGSQRLEYKCTFLDALVHESLVLLIDCVFFLVWLQGNEKGEWLNNLRFGVFGLGNRQYEHFNKVCWCVYIDWMHV